MIHAEPNVTKNRHKYVGGSDVPVILGLSKFKSQYELAQEKMGIIKNEFVGNEYTEYGHVMEPQIREYINLTTNYEFLETTTSCDEEGLRSNTDGVDYSEGTLLEIKTHGATPTIEIYKAQMQLYMYQNDLDQGLLALYRRSDDFDTEFDEAHLDMSVVVKRNEEIIQHMLHEIELFWVRCKWLRKNTGASEWDYNNCIKTKIIPGGLKPVSEDLQVKTTKFEPAVVEFNYDEIEQKLEENLKKYEGLTFTDKEATECRRAIADLRKGKRLVDQYRINTKKQLSEPIVAFEEQCKSLNNKFDSVLDPLLEQSNEFDEKQRELKHEKVKEIISKIVEDLDLDDDIAKQLVIEDRYLNKSTTLKSINEDLREIAENLITHQEHEIQNIELIKAHVEITNLRNEVELLDSSYVNLAKDTEIDEIRKIIDADAETLVKRKEQEEQDKIADVAKKAALAEKVETAKKDPLKDLRVAGAKKMKESFDEEQKEEVFEEVYKVEGTEEELDKLEEVMSKMGLTWSVVEDD